MKTLAEVADREWVWTRPRVLTREWDLRAGDEVVATLVARGVFGVRMAGETAGARWELAYEGLLLGRAVLRREGGVEPVLEFRPRWFGGGEVVCADGTRLRWKRGDFWGRRWRCEDMDGRLQLELTRLPGLMRPRTRVEPSDAGRARADLPELVLLAFFLLRLLERQSHTG